jgi:hypothetical protein
MFKEPTPAIPRTGRTVARIAKPSQRTADGDRPISPNALGDLGITITAAPIPRIRAKTRNFLLLLRMHTTPWAYRYMPVRIYRKQRARIKITREASKQQIKGLEGGFSGVRRGSPFPIAECKRGQIAKRALSHPLYCLSHWASSA